MTDDEQLGRFSDGLKPEVKVEVLKSNATTMDEAARMALNVHSALFGMSVSARFQNGAPKISRGNNSVPTPIELGNVQSSRFSQWRNGLKSLDAKEAARHEDLRSGLCFVCHQKGCRASRHELRKSKINNSEAVTESCEHSDQGN
jgi:hypothetical protein